jgi:hypothetical protein
MRIINNKTGKEIVVREAGAASGYRERIYLCAHIAEKHHLFGNNSELSYRYDPHKDMWKGFSMCSKPIKVKLEGTASVELLKSCGFEAFGV